MAVGRRVGERFWHNLVTVPEGAKGYQEGVAGLPAASGASTESCMEEATPES